jgi:hypothetical protein
MVPQRATRESTPSVGVAATLELPRQMSERPSRVANYAQTGVSDIPLTANGEKMVKEMGPRMMGPGSESDIKAKSQPSTAPSTVVGAGRSGL